MLFKIQHVEGDAYVDLDRVEYIHPPCENNKKYHLIITMHSGYDIKLIFGSEKRANDVAAKIANICSIDTIKRRG